MSLPRQDVRGSLRDQQSLHLRRSPPFLAATSPLVPLQQSIPTRFDSFLRSGLHGTPHAAANRAAGGLDPGDRDSLSHGAASGLVEVPLVFGCFNRGMAGWVVGWPVRWLFGPNCLLGSLREEPGLAR